MGIGQPVGMVNKKIKSRTDVVGVFPNTAALLRMAGSVLVEQHDEREAGERPYFPACFPEVKVASPRSSARPSPPERLC
ncbi:hypothetical protein E3T29_11810 [Cryobacterium sp. TMT1-66-1]|nr:hypothetical protein E3T29_11810 [Cryobacterium sp. TMT1-66-1]